MSGSDKLQSCIAALIDIPHPGYVGLVLALLDLYKVGFCVGALCALQCGKKLRGVGWQSRGILK